MTKHKRDAYWFSHGGEKIDWDVTETLSIMRSSLHSELRDVIDGGPSVLESLPAQEGNGLRASNLNLEYEVLNDRICMRVTCDLDEVVGLSADELFANHAAVSVSGLADPSLKNWRLEA